MEQEQTECVICTEKYNQTTRKPVQCEYCPFIACHKCTSTYILSQPAPHCMATNCTRTWTRKHITKHLSSTFRGREFKKHTENMLFDKERAFFQATQQEIEEDKRQSELQNQHWELEKQRREEIRQISLKYDTKLMELRHEMNTAPTKVRAQFVQRCIYDNCQGFMSSQWKCGLCDRHGCSKCNKPKLAHDDSEHVCNPDDVASVEAIRRETKPCPKCHTSIFKIHGCDQMWCTNCKTPFSWVNGTIITGPLHNPHYHEYLAQTGANHVDEFVYMECGEMVPDVLPREYRKVIENALEHESYIPKHMLLDLCRMILHVTYEELEHYHIPAEELQINRAERKSFLMKIYGEDEFKKIILKNYKEVNKNTEMRQIMEMVRDALTSIYLRMIDYMKNINPQVFSSLMHRFNKPEDVPVDVKNALLEFAREMNGVRVYANQCVQDINAAYQSVSKKLFSRSFQFIVPPERPAQTQVTGTQATGDSHETYRHETYR